MRSAVENAPFASTGPLEAYRPAFDKYANLLGLESDESQFFYDLCMQQTEYPLCEDMVTDMARLEAEYGDHVRVERKADDPRRRIDAITVINHDNPNGLAMVMLDNGHANERGGRVAQRALMELFAAHPKILSRLGYREARFCCTDQLADKVQRASRTNPQTSDLPDLCRLAPKQQSSWGYPSLYFRDSKPEATVMVVRLWSQYPDIIIEPHNGMIGSLIATTDALPGESALYTGVMRDFGLLVHDVPDEACERVFEPGVFQTPSRESVENVEGVENTDDSYGVNIGFWADYIHRLRGDNRRPPRHLIIDSAAYRYDGDPNEPLETERPYGDVLREHMDDAIELIEQMKSHYGDLLLNTYLDDAISKTSDPELVTYLLEAVDWWVKDVPAAYDSIAEYGAGQYPDKILRTVGEAAIVASYAYPNTIIYLGNLLRVAEMFDRPSLVEQIRATIDEALAKLKHYKPVPIQEQAAIQGFITMTGMLGMHKYLKV